jgi:hypothetical protein
MESRPPLRIWSSFASPSHSAGRRAASHLSDPPLIGFLAHPLFPSAAMSTAFDHQAAWGEGDHRTAPWGLVGGAATPDKISTHSRVMCTVAGDSPASSTCRRCAWSPRGRIVVRAKAWVRVSMGHSRLESDGVASRARLIPQRRQMALLRLVSGSWLAMAVAQAKRIPGRREGRVSIPGGGEWGQRQSRRRGCIHNLSFEFRGAAPLV